MKNEEKRKKNERIFGNWEDLPNGARQYFFEVQGHHGWRARYIKEVDSSEQTIKFYQEIFDENGHLVEIHEKYPVNQKHIKLGGK